MKGLLQNGLSVLGAALFLVCMGMILTRPNNFASSVSEIVEEIELKLEDPTVRIVLDAGHGGIDGGSSHHRLLEKNLTLKVVKSIQAKLKAAALNNVEIVLTRDDDTYLTLQQRVAVANRYAKSYFVSVHFNGSTYRSASGTETFYASRKPSIIENQVRRRLDIEADAPLLDTRGERFAQSVQEVLVRRLGTRDRGIRINPRLVLPRDVIGPSILVESVFLSNKTEGLKLRNPAFLEEIADSITEGIIDYLRESRLDPYAGIKVLPRDQPSPPSS